MAPPTKDMAQTPKKPSPSQGRSAQPSGNQVQNTPGRFPSHGNRFSPLQSLPTDSPGTDESTPQTTRRTSATYRPPHVRQRAGELQQTPVVSRPFADLAATHNNTGRSSLFSNAPANRTLNFSSPTPGPSRNLNFSPPPAHNMHVTRTRRNTAIRTPPALNMYGTRVASLPEPGPSSSRFPVTPGRGPTHGISIIMTPPTPRAASSGAIGVERQAGTLELTSVPQRRVCATTLALVRSRVAGLVRAHPDSIDARRIHEFLDQVFPRGGQTETIRCHVLSAVETGYRYPVEDADWNLWLQLVNGIPAARIMDKMLAVGPTAFDEVNNTFAHANLLARHADAPEGLLAEVVKYYNLDKAFDLNFNGLGGDDRNLEPK